MERISPPGYYWERQWGPRIVLDFDLLSNYSSISELRKVGFIWCDNWTQDTLRSRMMQVTMMKSKFPVTIRKAINDAIVLSPEQFFDHVNEALFNLFDLTPITIPSLDGNLFIKESKNKGLDCSVDTEDEVEYCLRVFSYLYKFIDSSWIPKTLEALPFYPLVLDVKKERNSGSAITVSHFITNFHKSSKICKNQISIEVFHSILLRLKEKYAKNHPDYCMAYMAFFEPSPEYCREFSFAAGSLCRQSLLDASEESTFRFLLNSSPSILETFYDNVDWTAGPFLHNFLDKR